MVLRSHVSAGGYQPLMTKSADGKIWFLPWDGVSVIDPHHIPFTNFRRPVHIEQVVANRKTYDTVPIRLEICACLHLFADLEIDYTALSLVHLKKFVFVTRWKAWIAIGKTSVMPTGLLHQSPSAALRFRVAACQ